MTTHVEEPERDRNRHGWRVLFVNVMGALIFMPLQGCRVGPVYYAPQMSDEQGQPFVSVHTQAALREATVSSEGIDNWWHLYDEPMAQQLTSEAISANLDLKIAADHLQAAHAVVDEARAGRYPSTTESIGAQYGRDLVLDAVSSGFGAVPQNEWTYFGQLEVSYELDLFGRIRRTVDAAKADAQVVQAVRDRVQLAVVSNTMDIYVQICALGERLSAARESLDVASRGRLLIVSQQSAGEATDFDLARADIIWARAKAVIPDLEGQSRAAVFELAAILGRSPAQAPEELLHCSAVPRLNQPIPIGDGASLLRRRPDVREAERRLAGATERVGLRMANLYPRINLAASVAEVANMQLKGPTAFEVGLGPLISWSYPNLAAARAELRISRADESAALKSFNKIVLQALKEAEQSLTRYGSELSRHEALKQASDRANDAYVLAQKRYQTGDISALDLLTTEQARIDTTAELALSDEKLGSAQVQVFKTLGGGWEVMAGRVAGH